MANVIEHIQKGEYDLVIRFCDETLEKTPEDHNLIIIKGWCLCLSDPKFKQDAYDCMIQWRNAKDLHEYSVSLAQDFFFILEDNEEIIRISETYLKKYPENSTFWYRMALSKGLLGFEKESIADLRKTIELDPAHYKARTNLGYLLLNQHNYEEAFEYYESRLKAFPYSNWFLDNVKHIDYWQGEPLAGKSILLWTEQGLGDTIQFSRYVNILAEQGANVGLLLHKGHCSLATIMNGLEGLSKLFLLNEGDKLTLPKTIDYHCPIMGVMKRVKLNEHNIPGQTPYLSAPTAHFKKWHFLRKKANSKPKIGLVWTTQTPVDGKELKNKLGTGTQIKNIPLQQLKPIMELPVDFYSLQFPVPEADKALMAEFGIQDMSANIQNFADTAAIISYMDLVITIDTSVAHMAGAMDKPVINMLPAISDWRWQEERTDSPWYPSMYLARQLKIGDWETVIKQIPELIKKLLAK